MTHCVMEECFGRCHCTRARMNSPTSWLRHHKQTKSAAVADPQPRKRTASCVSSTNMGNILVSSTNHFRKSSGGVIARSSPYTTCLSFRRSITSMADSVRPRRFAPLDPTKRKAGDDRPDLKGIVFDVDGTLCGSSIVLLHI